MAGRKSPWDDLIEALTNSSRQRGRGQINGFNVTVLVILLLCFMVYTVFFTEDPLSFWKILPSSSRTTSPPSSQANSSRQANSSNTTKSLGVEQRSIPIPNVEVCTVERCVDGDTIIVLSAGGKERVRFIGSDAPETVKPNWPIEPFGPEAAAYTKKRINEFNNRITLVADGDKMDKYNRRLALVYLDEDKTMLLNQELIRLGFAKAETRYNYSRSIKDSFVQAENLAKSEQRGIWSPTFNSKGQVVTERTSTTPPSPLQPSSQSPSSVRPSAN